MGFGEEGIGELGKSDGTGRGKGEEREVGRMKGKLARSLTH